MLFHSKTKDDTLSILETDRYTGLTSQKVDELQMQYGLNKLKEKKTKTAFQRFLDQFKDVMILILLAAAAVSFVIACIEKDPGEFF